MSEKQIQRRERFENYMCRKKEGEEKMRKEREAGYRKARMKYLQDLEKKTWAQEVELKQLMKEDEKEG